VYRAAVTFFDHIRIDKGVKIILDKKIPVAAGLGGGSSDAAAVFRGLQQLFGIRLDQDAVQSLAKSLGADVPFFMGEFNAAWGKGIGDVLHPVPSLEHMSILLVNPGFGVSTMWVYENFALTTKGNPYILGAEQIYGNLQEFLLPSGDSLLCNDLESVTISRYPEIGLIKQKMVAYGARTALMSGSGPTVFGLYENRDDVMRSYRLFQQQYRNVYLTTPYGVN
jgi:4-diphosphocytidyl-2-C-methyl-D-erythritol kinase